MYLGRLLQRAALIMKNILSISYPRAKMAKL
nr:MAG TPA: hypothetical protein [Caudoviricetes sp.]